MRIPSLPWLIQDQLRMLYVTIRGSYLGCDETQCKWVPLGGGAAGNSAKYFKKLQGLDLLRNDGATATGGRFIGGLEYAIHVQRERPRDVWTLSLPHNLIRCV
jgi:hypothetical protein